MELGRKIKILVVEDEADARMLYKDMLLTVTQFEVDEAVDGFEAVAMAKEKRYDLILMDIITPRKDGIEALTEIKSDPATFGIPKVVMLSNIAGDVAVEKTLDLGADGYMLKSDIELEELVTIVTQYFQ